MPQPKPVTPQKLAELEAEIKALQARLTDVFCVEEVDAIREQLTARAVVAEAAREQLEWNLRMELVRIREAEATALRAASDMREIAASIARLLGEADDEDDVETTQRHVVKDSRRLFV